MGMVFKAVGLCPARMGQPIDDQIGTYSDGFSHPTTAKLAVQRQHLK